MDGKGILAESCFVYLQPTYYYVNLFSSTITGLIKCLYKVRFGMAALLPHVELGCIIEHFVRVTDESICIREYIYI